MGLCVQGSGPLGRTLTVMTATKAQPLVVIAIVALFLYWVVQDPIGAAAMIHEVFTWILGFLQLIAERVVQFLSALT